MRALSHFRGTPSRCAMREVTARQERAEGVVEEGHLEPRHGVTWTTAAPVTADVRAGNSRAVDESDTAPTRRGAADTSPTRRARRDTSADSARRAGHWRRLARRGH